MEITLEDHEGKRIGSSDIQPTDIEMKVLRIPLITSNKNDHYVLELSLHVENVLLTNILEVGKLDIVYHRPKVDPHFIGRLSSIAEKINLTHFLDYFFPLFTSSTLFYELHSLYLLESDFPTLGAQQSNSQKRQTYASKTSTFTVDHYFFSKDVIQNIFLDVFALWISIYSPSSSLSPYFRYQHTIQSPAGHLSYLPTSSSDYSLYIFLFSQATRICLNSHQIHHPKYCQYQGDIKEIPCTFSRNTLFKDIVHSYRINPLFPASPYVVRLYFINELQASANHRNKHSPHPSEYKYQIIDIKFATPFQMWLFLRDLKRCTMQKQLFSEATGSQNDISSASFGPYSTTPVSPTSRNNLFSRLPDPFFWESNALYTDSVLSGDAQDLLMHHSCSTPPLHIRSPTLFNSSQAPIQCRLLLDSYTQSSSNHSTKSSLTSFPKTHIGEMKIKSDTSTDTILSVFPQQNALSTMAIEKTLNLNSLTYLDVNCDYSRTSELLLEVQVSRISGLLKPQIYDILPMTYAVIKICGLTAYRTANLHEMHARNIIVNTIFLPITTISDGITNLIEGQDLMIQLPSNGAFFISIDEHDISHLGRSAKMHTLEDCSRGLMVFLYHGSKGTETIVGEQFIPLYKLLSKNIKSRLTKSVPLDKIFFDDELQGESYTLEAEMDIIQSLKLGFISASLYRVRNDIESTVTERAVEVDIISQSVNLVAHLVTWNGKEIPLPFLWDNVLSAPIRGREFVFSASHGIMYAEFVRITYQDCQTKAPVGMTFIPIRDFIHIQGRTTPSSPTTHSSQTYSILFPLQSAFEDEYSHPLPFYLHHLNHCPNSYPTPPVVGYVVVNLSRIHESVTTLQSQPLRFSCRSVFVNESTAKWPGYALASDSFQKNISKKYSEEIHVAPLDDMLRLEIVQDEFTPSFDDNETKAIILQNPQSSLFAESPLCSSNDSPPPHHSHAQPPQRSTSTGTKFTREELVSKNKYLILALCKERIDMAKTIVNIPWDQVLRIAVITPSVLSITIFVHRYSYQIFGREVFNPKFPVELFICPCNAPKLYLWIKEKLNLCSIRSRVSSYLHERNMQTSPDNSVSLTDRDAFGEVFHVVMKEIDSLTRALGGLSYDMTQIDDILHGLSKNTIDDMIIEMNSSIWNRLKKVSQKRLDSTSPTQLKASLLMKTQCQLWLYAGILIKDIKEKILPSTFLSHDDLKNYHLFSQYLISRVTGDHERYLTEAAFEIDEAPIGQGITVSDVHKGREYLTNMLEFSFYPIVFDTIVLLWGQDLISEDPKRPFLSQSLEMVVNSYRLQISKLMGKYFNSHGKLKYHANSSSQQKYPSQAVIALFSLVVDLNDTLLTILSNTLTQFGLHMTSYNNSSFITMSSSNESIDDSNLNGPNLLLTSMFDVETAISDLTHVLLYEMKEWVVKIRMEWKKKEENDLHFKCKNLPWYPVQLQEGKFVSYLPEDVASALNSYLETNELTKFEPSDHHADRLSPMTSNLQSKLHLKIQLVYVTSFQYLVMLYQDEMCQLEKKLQLLTQSDLGESLGKNKRKSVVLKFFTLNESPSVEGGDSADFGDITEEFGVSHDVNSNEIEDECMVWYCSCVNDIWRACSHHFVRQKLSRSISNFSKSTVSGSRLESIDEEDDVYTEWDGVGVVSDEVRKIEREFSKAMRYGLLVIAKSMFGHLEELLSLPNLKKSWIDTLADNQTHPNPVAKCLKIIESYLANYESWLEPVCFILLLETCSDLFIEKYMLMLKSVFTEGLYKLSVDKEHFVAQIRADELLIERTFSESLRSGKEWMKPQLRGSYSKSLSRFLGRQSTAQDDSIIHEITFPLPQIRTLLLNDIRSEPYVQVVQDFIEVAKIRGDLAQPLSYLVEAIESAKFSSKVGNISAIRRVSLKQSPEQVVLQEYIQLLQSFSLGSRYQTFNDEKYSRKTMLRRVYGDSAALDHGVDHSVTMDRFSMNFRDFDINSTAKTPSHYNLEVSLEQIRIIGLNPQELLNRDSPTLYISLWIQESFMSSTSPSHEIFPSSVSSLSPFTISLQYSTSTSSWQLKTDSSHPSPSSSHHFLLSKTYSQCLLIGEVWYKSLLTRKKKSLGMIQCPLAGLDTNETKILKQLDVKDAIEEFKKRIQQDNLVIEVQIPMRLTRR